MHLTVITVSRITGALMPEAGFGGRGIAFDLDGKTELKILEDEMLTITVFQVSHGGVEAAVGYRFDYKDRSVVISGDTSRSDTLEHVAHGADILVHEALNEDMIDIMSAEFFAQENSRMSTIFQEIKAIHTTPVDAARSAGHSRCRDAYLQPYHSTGPKSVSHGLLCSRRIQIFRRRHCSGAGRHDVFIACRVNRH